MLGTRNLERYWAAQKKLRDALYTFVREMQAPVSLVLLLSGVLELTIVRIKAQPTRTVTRELSTSVHDPDMLVWDAGKDAETMPEYPSQVVRFDGTHIAIDEAAG